MRHRAKIAAALGTVLICTALHAASVEEQLMQADREFARATEERGIDGWLTWFTPDAARVVLDGPIARGHDEIRAMDGPLFADPALRLRWEPTDAGQFGDGDHGFTRGRYTLARTSPDGGETVLGRGNYLSIWRRESDGWRVILDTGTEERKEATESASD